MPGDGVELNIGDSATAAIIDPDFNFDSRAVEFVDFNFLLIDTNKMQGPIPVGFAIIVVNMLALFTTTEEGFREQDINSDVFSITVSGQAVSTLVAGRGSIIKLIYNDETPSGGGNRIRIETKLLVNANMPEIIFDKQEYTPFDEVKVTIISLDSNADKSQIDTITPLISTSSDSGFNFRLAETGLDTNIFTEDINLTPTRARPGDLIAQREDGLTVEFRIDPTTVVTKSVFVNYHVGSIDFDRNAFGIDERGIVRVIDPDQNFKPDTIDTIDVRVWSNTDRGGLLLTLRETGDRTGIFEEFITFTTDEESSGTRLRISEGDTLTAKYTDRTLPPPAALDFNGIFTVEVEEVFASSFIGSTEVPLERASVEEPQLVDQLGLPIDDIDIGTQVLVQSEITSNQDRIQEFVYVVRVEEEGVTTSLSWVSGQLPAKDSIIVAQSWIPEKSGRYEIEVFVWESMLDPVPLSPIKTLSVTVA